MTKFIIISYMSLQNLTDKLSPYNIICTDDYIITLKHGMNEFKKIERDIKSMCLSDVECIIIMFVDVNNPRKFIKNISSAFTDSYVLKELCKSKIPIECSNVFNIIEHSDENDFLVYHNNNVKEV